MSQLNLSNSKFSKYDICALVVIALFVAFMLSMSWLKWLHPIIDCGREVYIPWQLLNGKILYRDLACYYGPFAPYITALWLKLFGLHLNVLYSINFIINVFNYLLIYYISRKLLNPWLSTLVVLIYIEIGSISPSLGGYEGAIFPYSFAALYGLFFFLLQLAFILVHLMHKEKNIFLYLSAFAGSLGISCKQDVAMSVLLLTIVYSIYLFLNKKNFLLLKYWLMTLIIPSILYSIFFLYLPAGFYIKRYLLPTYVAFSDYGTSTLVPFFTLKHLMLSLENIIYTLLFFSIVTILLYALIWLYKRIIYNNLANRSKIVAISITILILAFVFNELLNILFHNLPVIEDYLIIVKVMSWIPSLISIIVCYKLFRIIKFKAELSSEDLYFIIIALASVALAMRCYIYCFTTYLIVPSITIIIYLFYEKLPPLIWKHSLDNIKITKYAVFGSIVLFIILYGVRNFSIFTMESGLVSTKYGSFKTFKPYAAGYNSLIYFINNYTKPKDQITVFPEETLINFLTMRNCPTTITQYMDINNIMMTKEERVKNFKELAQSKYMMISNFPYFLQKKYYFGINYQEDIAKWIKQHYDLIAEAGKYEVVLDRSPTAYGFLIYKRKE